MKFAAEHAGLLLATVLPGAGGAVHGLPPAWLRLISSITVQQSGVPLVVVATIRTKTGWPAVGVKVSGPDDKQVAERLFVLAPPKLVHGPPAALAHEAWKLTDPAAVAAPVESFTHLRT